MFRSEKTLWRMLYETAARASEILARNVEDLDLEQRRAPIRSKGGDTEFVYWDTRTAHLLPGLPDGTSRTSGPLFLAARRPVSPPPPATAWNCTSFATPRRPTSAPEGPAPADHGQDPAQIPTHRHALRQTGDAP